MNRRAYAAIDLKSYYSSVECMERNLDPLTTNLVVADVSRTEKTICLAVSPSLKAYGIPGHPRLFEVVRKVREINARRRQFASGHTFSGKSWDDTALRKNPSLELDYITAVPQMSHYMRKSAEIYSIYLRFVAPEDIFAYSVDEVFIDLTNYLDACRLTPRQMVQRMIREVYRETGITATAGIGTNLYLCKAAMDIWAKRIQPDEDGVRIAELDELSYRRLLWGHRPLTDFWRVGRGYTKKLEARGLYTMGDIARCSLYNEDLLYQMFGANAELLIDHAWGWESCTMADIKAYRPESSSMGAGQVLHVPYDFQKARTVTREMADALSLDLVAKGLVTDQIVLTVGYDIENLTDPRKRLKYKGQVTTDRYGRQVPKHAHGTENLGRKTSSTRAILDAATRLYDRIVDRSLLVRRITITANHVTDEDTNAEPQEYEQLDLFTNPENSVRQDAGEQAAAERERRMQEALLAIKKRYGKNAILRGMNFQEGATMRDRNRQIGGHKA